jgi:hypothetical protein
MKYKFRKITWFLLSLVLIVSAMAQVHPITDTAIIFTPSDPNLIRTQSYKPLASAWGLDLLLSNNGFGLGGFYRHEITDEYSWMINFAISDVKDDAEFEQYDYYYGQTFVPGKKNRLLLMPLTASIQYRLFKDDIVDNFRPFIMAGLGPTMVFVAPYSTYNQNGYQEQIDFFSSLKYGKLRYTLGGFIGAGAYFGLEKGTISGLSVKYIFAPFPDGIEVMYGGFIRNFGGLFITLTFGSLF